MLTLGRLPPILLEDEPCLLPLAEASAAALLAALVDAQQAEARAGLVDAVTLDPALALWACFHYARSAGAAVPPTVADLEEWLSANVSALVASEVTVDSCPPPSKAKLPPRAKLAELAAKDVARAEQAVGAKEASCDARYPVALLGIARQLAGGGGMLQRCSRRRCLVGLPAEPSDKATPRAATRGRQNLRREPPASARVRAAGRTMACSSQLRDAVLRQFRAEIGPAWPAGS